MQIFSLITFVTPTKNVHKSSSCFQKFIHICCSFLNYNVCYEKFCTFTLTNSDGILWAFIFIHIYLPVYLLRFLYISDLYLLGEHQTVARKHAAGKFEAHSTTFTKFQRILINILIIIIQQSPLFYPPFRNPVSCLVEIPKSPFCSSRLLETCEGVHSFPDCKSNPVEVGYMLEMMTITMDAFYFFGNI